MKARAELLATCAAVVICAGLAPSVRAADMPVKAPAAVPVLWWYEGFAEIGGRAYLNDPDKTTLGKFYRYEDWSPGVFGNFYFGAHKTGADPLDITAWGKNIGWDDQAFGLGLAKPGTYYLDFSWDETPHVYAKNAGTTFGPIGGNVLSTPTYPGFGAGLTTTALPTSTEVTNNQAFVNAHTALFDLGYRRDTASAKARWTPDDSWDITADYSHMHRDGTQPLNAATFTTPVTGNGPSRAPMELPKPVDDTTQNGNLKAEYAGSSPWGKPFNVALGYGVSLYNNDIDSLTFQNPWATGNGVSFPLWNRYSLSPDNQAQSFSASTGVGLPWNSRYMGTIQYSIMTQDQSFLPSTINPAITPAVLPSSNLDGDARTLLSNNVLNTKITSDLSSTLRYRYYDYHSNQGPMTIAGLFESGDTTHCTTSICPNPTTETAFPSNFNKQNASGQLDYRPLKWLNVGAAYEWERWWREIDGVDVVTSQTGSFDAVTNENAVKAFADLSWGFSTLRASLRYGERRFDGDYIRIANNNNAFRTVDYQDRNSTVGKFSWAVVVIPTITVTPVGGFQHDDYPADGVSTFGITSHDSWNVGGDVAWAVTRMASLYVSYMREDGKSQTYTGNANVAAGAPANLTYNTRDLDDTFIVGTKITLIPEKLLLNANYTYTKGTSQWGSGCGPTGSCIAITPFPTFPDVHNTNQRLDASAKYMFDDAVVKAAGFSGKAFVKARVVWERNSNDNWQAVSQQLGLSVNPTDATMARAVFLGTGDPNYNVVVGMLSFGVKW
jgi:MtrB/PioB family decaheme-associated outer membrane protein